MKAREVREVLSDLERHHWALDWILEPVVAVWDEPGECRRVMVTVTKRGTVEVTGQDGDCGVFRFRLSDKTPAVVVRAMLVGVQRWTKGDLR